VFSASAPVVDSDGHHVVRVGARAADAQAAGRGGQVVVVVGHASAGSTCHDVRRRNARKEARTEPGIGKALEDRGRRGTGKSTMETRPYL
jgi:hypothetical protein